MLSLASLLYCTYFVIFVAECNTAQVFLKNKEIHSLGELSMVGYDYLLCLKSQSFSLKCAW